MSNELTLTDTQDTFTQRQLAALWLIVRFTPRD